MKQVIDNLNSMTDWVVNSPSEISENEFTDYIAGLNSKSLMIKFVSSDSVKTATKTFSTPFNVSNYDSLVFSIWSQNKGRQSYIKADDFSYKINIDGINEFYIPIYETFCDVTIGIEDITEINQIEITALHDDTDYVIISEMIAEKEESSIDIMTAVKEHIDYFINEDHGDGISLASGITGTLGNNYIGISGYPAYIERYAVVYITDGVNSETHQISDCDGEKYYFNSNYDGETLQNTYTSATIYLTFPSIINPGEMEVRLPGIAIWGITPEPLLTDAKLYTKVDTFSVNNDNFKERIIGQILSYNILIDLEARHNELIEKMAQTIRKFIGRESLWINGRRHDIFFDGIPAEIKGEEGINIIPKVQYVLKVQLRENINNRITVPKTQTINLEVEVQN